MRWFEEPPIANVRRSSETPVGKTAALKIHHDFASRLAECGSMFLSARHRRRNACGGWPKIRMQTLRMRSRSPNPTWKAI
jgi:hypothetical protein